MSIMRIFFRKTEGGADGHSREANSGDRGVETGIGRKGRGGGWMDEWMDG